MKNGRLNNGSSSSLSHPCILFKSAWKLLKDMSAYIGILLINPNHNSAPRRGSAGYVDQKVRGRRLCHHVPAVPGVLRTRLLDTVINATCLTAVANHRLWMKRRMIRRSS